LHGSGGTEGQSVQVGFKGASTSGITIGHDDDHRLSLAEGDEVVKDEVGVALLDPSGLILASTVLQIQHRITGVRVLGILVPKDLLPRYRQHLVDVYGGRARDLGWKTKAGESEDARLLRPALLRVLANQGQDSKLIAQAKKLALAWLDDHKAVDPDMLGVVLTTAARFGDRDLFDRMRAAAKKEKEENFFSGRSTKYTGGPRILTQVLESIDLCVAYKNAQEASVAEFLETYRPAQSVGAGNP